MRKFVFVFLIVVGVATATIASRTWMRGIHISLRAKAPTTKDRIHKLEGTLENESAEFDFLDNERSRIARRYLSTNQELRETRESLLMEQERRLKRTQQAARDW